MNEILLEVAAAPWKFRNRKPELVRDLCSGNAAALPSVLDAFRQVNTLPTDRMEISVGKATDVCDVHEIFERENHTFQQPVYLSEKKPAAIVRGSTRENASISFQAFLSLPGKYYVSLFGQNNIVFTREEHDLKILPEVSSSHFDVLRLFATLDGVRRPNLLAKTILLINDEYGGQNYCHWVVDWLPRIKILKDKGLMPSDYLIVLPFRPMSFHIETLEIFGIPKSRVISLLRLSDFASGLIECERFISLSSCGSRFQHALQNGSRVLAGKMRSAFNVGHSSVASRKIILQRRETRKLVFSPQDQTLLGKSGFQEISTEGMSFREQVAAFSAASHVVAAHGAGLANLLFVQPMTNVLEVFPDDPWPNPVFYVISNAVKANYSCCVGVTLPLTETAPVHARDIVVPAGSLGEWLQVAV